MEEWLRLAARVDVVRRSFRVAAIVGTILVLINYSDALYPFRIGAGDWIKILLTYCVPYCVATYAAVGAIRERTPPPEG
jgi:hypothetical protein